MTPSVTSFSEEDVAGCVDVARVEVEEVVSEEGRANEARRHVTVDVEELGVDLIRADGAQVGVGCQADLAEADGVGVSDLQHSRTTFWIRG